MIQRLWRSLDDRVRGGVNPFLHDPAVHYWDHAGYMMRRFPRGFRSLLDVGIGSGWLGATVRAVYGVKPDCVEIHRPYIDHARWAYNLVWEMDFEQSLGHIPSASYDIVCCMNTIEHAENPLAVLEHLERIAAKAVFVSSINHFSPSVAWDGNEYQIHQSLLTASELKRRGYNVRGAGRLHDYVGILARRLPTLDSAYLAWRVYL